MRVNSAHNSFGRRRLTSSSNTLLWSRLNEIIVCLDSLWLLLLLRFPGTWALCWDYSHYLVLELLEKSALGGFGHEVGNHIAGWAPLHGQLLFINPIRYKEVADMDMLRALAARSLAIPFEKDGTFIVLVDNVFSDLVALGLQEISCPADGWHTIIY